jgi:type II secretory pathway pseudopilin PulG
MKTKRHAAGGSQLVVLVVIAVVLGAGMFVLDRSNAGAKESLNVETRGVRLMSALTRYKLEHGTYPSKLEDLVPQHVSSVASCPDGTPMQYRTADGEYLLACPVGVRRQPYSYSSRSRSWDS